MPKGRAYNKGQGKEGKRADMMRKKATMPKGKGKQPEGSSMETMRPRKARKEKNMGSGMEDYSF